MHMGLKDFQCSVEGNQQILLRYSTRRMSQVHRLGFIRVTQQGVTYGERRMLLRDFR